MCPDCKDTGVYVGLNATEPCQTCGGKKPEPVPEAKFEQPSDTWKAAIDTGIWRGLIYSP